MTEMTIAAVNARSVELMREAREHVRDVLETIENPGVDVESAAHSAFEGWVIQKLAGLQIAAEALAERGAS